MEYIPEQYQIEDMPMAAEFVTDDMGLQVLLAPGESKRDPGTDQWVLVPNTRCRVQFKAGALVVKNSGILELLMNTESYKNGKIRISEVDESGFWRNQGAVKTKTIEVVKFIGSKQPAFGKLKLDKEPPKNKVMPIKQVS